MAKSCSKRCPREARRRWPRTASCPRLQVLYRFAGQIKNHLHETGQDVKGLYSAGLNRARIGLIRDRRKRFRASMVGGQVFLTAELVHRVGAAWCGPDQF